MDIQIYYFPISLTPSNVITMVQQMDAGPLIVSALRYRLNIDKNKFVYLK